MGVAPFAKILCAVDGGPQSAEAARQAIALARPGVELRFVTVFQTVKQHVGSSPDPSEEPAQRVLRESVRLAKEAGISTSSEILNALYAADVLLPESRDYDLLAIGAPDRSRAAGIALAETASRIVHDAEGAVLVARRPPTGSEFPKSILFAGDGAADSRPPAQVASQLADAFDAQVEVIQADGKVVETIVEAAEERRASLIVTGHRGLSGLRALASVSERVVHSAPCSVLLVPDGEAE